MEFEKCFTTYIHVQFPFPCETVTLSASTRLFSARTGTSFIRDYIIQYETVTCMYMNTYLVGFTCDIQTGRYTREKGYARLCIVARDYRAFTQQKCAAFSRVSAYSRRVSTSLYYEKRMDSLRSCVLSSLRLYTRL